MRLKSTIFLFAGAALATMPTLAAASIAPAQVRELPRKASLGVALAPPAEGASGAVIHEVLPGMTAERIGARQGDVIVRAGGQAMASPATVVEYAGQLRAGVPVELVVRRDGAEVTLAGPAAGRPFERYEGATADYGAVPFRDGFLRDILVTPAGAGEPPVLFLLPGFSCVSIEPSSPAHPYRRLGDSMIAAGVAYYRVEKPGMGDSTGGTQCVDIDYATELDAFRAAYKHLVDARGVSPDRIFMFGHSLGGLQAPMLAAEQPPRGVAVYGTVYRNWADYHRNVGAFQPFLTAGQDPVELARQSDRLHGMFDRYYTLRQAPARIAAEAPAYADAMGEVLAWDGGERTMGRHYKFMQDLAHQPLAEAWRDTRSNVLSIYGESDLVALFDEDHRLIADVVNHYRPGTARNVEVANTGHGMDLIGPRAAQRQQSAAAAPQPPAQYNPEVGRLVAEWVRESMAKPPVRLGASRGG